MAFKPLATSGETTKRYLWLAANWGQQLRLWLYVTPDSGPTVSSSGYITDQSFIDTMVAGDLILVLEVGSISDSREISADVGTGGLVDLTLHLITENTGGTIDLSDDLMAGQPPSGDYDTRADVNADEVPANVNHITTAGYTTTGDGGGALYKRVGSEPSHNLKVSSNGATIWWELVPEHGVINVRQAGAKGNGTTNDGQAFLDCLSFASLNNNGVEEATYEVRVPASDGAYYCGTTILQLKRQVRLIGSGSGLDGGEPCILDWDANITGIIVQRHDTILATTEASSTGGDGSIIKGIKLTCAAGVRASVTDGAKGHGIWLRARALIEDVVVNAFPGDGIHINASSGGGPGGIGNANNWMINRVAVLRNQTNGLFVQGSDTNAGSATGVDASLNGRWGIHDTSFLGNTYVGCHSSANGLAEIGNNPTGNSSRVENSGTIYAANAGASEANYVATEPGTDANNTIWIELGSGSANSNTPAWQSSQAEGTYFAGGSYHTDTTTASNAMVGCYQEGGQSPAQIAQSTWVLGGFSDKAFGSGISMQGSKLRGPLIIDNTDNDVFATATWSGKATHMLMGTTGDPDKLITVRVSDDGGSAIPIVSYDRTFDGWRVGAMLVTGITNSDSYGRASALPSQKTVFDAGVWIGNGAARARFFGGMVANAPASGETATGDFWLNYAPTNSGAVGGFRTITAGTFGTDAVSHEFFFVPNLPSDKGAVLRPHTSQNVVEWRAAPKAGTDTIANSSATVAVSFATDFASANYSIGLSSDGDEEIWVTSKAVGGFTLNRAGTSGARAVDWTATPHEDL